MCSEKSRFGLNVSILCLKKRAEENCCFSFIRLRKLTSQISDKRLKYYIPDASCWPSFWQRESCMFHTCPYTFGQVYMYTVHNHMGHPHNMDLMYLQHCREQVCSSEARPDKHIWLKVISGSFLSLSSTRVWSAPSAGFSFNQWDIGYRASLRSVDGDIIPRATGE